MSLRTSELRVIIAGDAASYLRTMAEVTAATDEAANGMGTKFEKSTSKVGSLFSDLGQKMQNFGIPFGKTVSDIGSKLSSAESKASKFSSVISDVGKISLGVGAAAFAGIAVESIRMGTAFQAAMTQVETGAGELPQNMKKVSDGVLAMAGTVGQTPLALAKGLYTIESAGYHGAAGLKVLKAAAEGAAVGNADMGTVADATTTVLNAYGLSASKSTSVVNQLIAVEKTGKSHMQDVAAALSAVVPVAAAAHLSFAQVGGALSTLTGQGMSAEQGTQDLAHAIRALENPNTVAVNEMQQLGLNSNQVAKNLGKNGLTGTMNTLTETILKNMGPSGEVMLKAFNQSKAASGDLQIMLGAMNPKTRSLALEFEKGSLTVTQFRKALPTNEQGTVQQFSTLYNLSHGFNAQLKAGQPAAQTYEAALAKMTGGATGMNVALMLTGSHAATFASNVRAVGSAAHHGGSRVHDFGLVQQTLSFQMKQAKAGAEALADKFGLMLIPWVEKAIHVTSSMVGWMTKHKAIAEGLGIAIGTVLAGAIAVYVGGIVVATTKSIASFVKMGIQGGIWATKMMTSSGRAELAQQRAAKAAQTTATETQTAADQQVAAGEQVAASSETTAATVETEGGVADAALETTATTAEATGAAVDTAMGPIGLALVGVGLAAGLLMSHWKTVWADIKKTAKAVWDWVDPNVFKPIAKWLGPTVTANINALKSVWKTGWTVIHTAVSDAWKIIKPIFDGIEGALSAISKAASAVGGFISSIFGGGGGHSTGAIQTHNLPHAAKGGLVTRPTLLIAGEAGPEMIVPLSSGGGMSLQQPGGLPRTSASGTPTMQINYAPNVVISGTTEQMTQQFQKMLDEHSQELADRIAAHAA